MAVSYEGIEKQEKYPRVIFESTNIKIKKCCKVKESKRRQQE